MDNLSFAKIDKVNDKTGTFENNEFVYVYFMRFDGDPAKLKLQASELQDARFISIPVLKKELDKKPERFVPHGKYWDEVMKEVS